MIRHAKPCDLQAVLNIGREAFPYKADRFGAAWLLWHLAQPGVSLYVDAPGPGVVRGYLMLEQLADGCRVRMVATDAMHRGRGVARGLLGMVTGRATAWVREDNTASRALFTAAGWLPSVAPRKRRGHWMYFTRGVV